MGTDEWGQAFERALLAMDRVGARETLMVAAQSVGVLDASEQVITPALEHIGDDWERGGVSLAQLYMAGRIAEQIVGEVLPQSVPGDGEAPQIAIAVLEDQHALGKRLVLSALRSSGHAVADYGLGVSVQRLVERCYDDQPRILLISTLMLPAALHVHDVVDQLALSGSRPVVLVGGAPFRLDPELWREVGADGVGRNSTEAIQLVDRFLGGAL
jgi:methanogenic corrinoid protein MtbC1